MMASASEAHMADVEWNSRVKGMLKAELKRRNLTYQDLAAKLGEIGVRETEANLRNKVSRGGFSAAFFVQCLRAIGVQSLRLEE
jgi:hypothetical protein